MDAATYWDRNLRIHFGQSAPSNWIDSPQVWEAMPQLSGDYQPNYWLNWIRDRFQYLEYGLSICSGDGSLERIVILSHI
jgi:hypothetical protein